MDPRMATRQENYEPTTKYKERLTTWMSRSEIKAGFYLKMPLRQAIEPEEREHTRQERDRDSSGREEIGNLGFFGAHDGGRAKVVVDGAQVVFIGGVVIFAWVISTCA